jgi:hypothetical protein
MVSFPRTMMSMARKYECAQCGRKTWESSRAANFHQIKEPDEWTRVIEIMEK